MLVHLPIGGACHMASYRNVVANARGKILDRPWNKTAADAFNTTNVVAARWFLVAPRTDAQGDMSGSKRVGLLGVPKQVAVERGLAEFRAGRPVILASPQESVIALPVDGMTDASLVAFRQLCSPA